MTFANSAWAIDGALLTSSLARRAEYAATSGAQGTVQKPDLAVSELNVPGVGVNIAPGVGLLRNLYQTTPNETYVASNPSVHTIPSVDMPPSSTSAKSYIVAVVIGDPEFSQIGHPWMGSDDPPAGEEQDFEYVRPTVIEVSPGATKLDVSYPNLPLARIDIPANTTTITNSMITDLRHLALPRQSQEVRVSPEGTWTSSNARPMPYQGWADFGNLQYTPTVQVPEWANRAIMISTLNSARIQDNSKNIFGFYRGRLGSQVGTTSRFDIEQDSSNGAERITLINASEFSDISSLAGQEVEVRFQATQSQPDNATLAQKVQMITGSQQFFDIRFFEE